MQNRINLKMAMAKNNPNRIINPTLKYHTPCLITIGQSGNSTMAKIPATTPAAIALAFHCGPSYSHT